MMSSTASTYPTGIDGVVVAGSSGRWSLRHGPTGRSIGVGMGHLGIGHGNGFPTRKAASAAAARLAAALPNIRWSDTDPDAGDLDPLELAEKLTDAFTGTTKAQRDAAAQAEADIASGAADRQDIDVQLTAEGHTVLWRRHGQRSWRGKCACGHTAKVTYSSRRRSHDIEVRDATGTLVTQFRSTKPRSRSAA